MSATELPDREARRQVAEELDSTLFLAAAAGSGKTTVLVSRVVALIDAGTDLGNVVAITFTEKAAAELRGRIGEALEANHADPVVAGRRQTARQQLDEAAIGTIHGFAHRLLSDHPLEIGLPPHIEVADELTSSVAADERWQMVRDELLEDERLAKDPALERALTLGLSAGITLDHIRQLAEICDDNWHLVSEAFLATDPPPVVVVDRDHFARRLAAVAEERHHALSDGDSLCQHLADMADVAADLAGGTETDALESLIAFPRGAWKGAQGSWLNDARLAAVRDTLTGIEAERDAVVASVRDACLRTLARFVAEHTLRHANTRREAGKLEFHDLLVLARDLLRHPVHGTGVRASLTRRYQYVLIDEFQDTDPLQLELALLLTTPANAEQPSPGRLFVVGDPMQSIYRFRRADVAAFDDARSRIGAAVVRLSANFRSAEPVLAWINYVFASVIGTGGDGQPGFEPLDATRPAPATGPPVLVLDVVHDDSDAKALVVRQRETQSIAAVATRVVAEGWSVSLPGGGHRPAGYGDIAILLPARTSLPELEAALQAASVPYRTDASSLVYASREVRDLLLTLQAIDDLTDQLALVSALRSPLFGCSDVELALWKRAGGEFDLAVDPAGVDGPVGVVEALTFLREQAGERWWLSPSELLERIVDERRVLEAGLDGPQWRDVWRRVRFLIDQARAWSDGGGVTLRAYLSWARRQQVEGVRVGEAILPETDHDAVRILTIHAAKGLEFPVTIVSGLGSAPNAGGRVAVQWSEPAQIACTRAISTSGFEAARLTEVQLDDRERRRLLYVACTRARDHLVVSLHRKGRSNNTSADLLAEAAVGAPGEVVTTAVMPSAEPGVPSAAQAVFDIVAWRRQRETVFTRASRPSTRSATAIARDLAPAAMSDAGLRKGAVDLDQPPWQRGRYGTAIGRAVHAVLQRVDLATGAGVAELARAQAAAEGVLDHEVVIAQLARSALAAPIVVAAAHLPHWRELYVGAPVGDRVVEGYLDLLVRTPEGLVVVDYKTDHLASPGDLDERVRRYRPQAAAYAVAVSAVLGEPVARAAFVFCTPTEPIERDVIDLDAAMAEVRAALSAPPLD